LTSELSSDRPKRTIKLELEFDGSYFHGWQYQPDVPTVQGALEIALHRITGEEPRVTGASRTDTGVHALGMVAHFRIYNKIPTNRLLMAMNSLLPTTITINSVIDMPDEFHARKAAHSKSYRYVIYNRRFPSPFFERYAWHVLAPLDIELMRQAARYLIGLHDFSSFQSAECNSPTPVKRVIGCDLRVPDQDPHLIYFEIQAESYLMHMIRIVIGTLADVGTGKLTVSDFQRILAARKRSLAGMTAPGQGLFLLKIFYRDISSLPTPVT
jgi:tRNA pseudouridine38-40 synthase